MDLRALRLKHNWKVLWLPRDLELSPTTCTHVCKVGVTGLERWRRMLVASDSPSLTKLSPLEPDGSLCGPEHDKWYCPKVFALIIIDLLCITYPKCLCVESMVLLLFSRLSSTGFPPLFGNWTSGGIL